MHASDHGLRVCGDASIWCNIWWCWNMLRSAPCCNMMYGFHTRHTRCYPPRPAVRPAWCPSAVNVICCAAPQWLARTLRHDALSPVARLRTLLRQYCRLLSAWLSFVATCCTVATKDNRAERLLLLLLHASSCCWRRHGTPSPIVPPSTTSPRCSRLLCHGRIHPAREAEQPDRSGAHWRTWLAPNCLSCIMVRMEKPAPKAITSATIASSRL